MGVAVADGLRLDAVEAVVRHRLRDEGSKGLGHGGLDGLALAGPGAVAHGFEHAEEGVAAADEVGGEAAEDAGVAGRIGGGGGDAAEQIDDAMESGEVLERAGASKGGDGEVDDVGPDAADVVVGQAELVGDAGGEVLDDDVADRGELLGDGEPFGDADVEDEAALVGVHHVESAAAVDAADALGVGGQDAHRLEVRILDEDDLGAEPSKHLGDVGHGDHLAEVEHAEPLERRRPHAVPPGGLPRRSRTSSALCCPTAGQGEGSFHGVRLMRTEKPGSWSSLPPGACQVRR